VEFGILGPLRVAVHGRDVVLPAKQRVLLAALLLRANRVVPMDTLIETLWDDEPPPSARNTVHGYVKRLRQMPPGAAGERIVTRSPGYVISVADGELDLDRFTSLRDRARSAAASGDWLGAAGQLREALALWRDEPLADVPSAVLQREEVPGLAELRLLALESRIEADLRLGRHADLVAELHRLASIHPLREQVRGQLMLALYRCGQQAEALAAFRGIDRLLRDELGIAPGPELQKLHRRILAADPGLDASPVPASTVPAADPAVPGATAAGLVPPPAQLPPDTTDFTGRDEQVRQLCELLAAAPAKDRPGAVVISAVAGMGGIGKTALAVHVAHRLRDRFPDGQLYVSLLGATSPQEPADVLARLLRELGVPDGSIPADEAGRSARYRTLVADRSMLIVLDDARDAAQVLPLLPGSASCAVIVTSRNTLPGLPGAALLGLQVLSPHEARALFTAIIGRRRAAAEPDAIAVVLASCAGLPLAVRIAASRLASRPGWSIAHLGARLADERSRLAELTAGDLAVRASFAVSYEALPADGQEPARVFRLLGLPGSSDLGLPAIAALAGRPAAEVAAALETLADACLAESPAPERFRLHDLLRSYAAELAESTDSEDDRNAALGRMLRWFGGQAVIAGQVLAPARGFPVIVPVQAAAPAAMTDPAQALDWFETELANLTATTRRAAELGLHDVAAQVALAMWDFFQRTPYVSDWLAVSQAGVRSARRLGDDAVLSWLLNSLGQAHCMLGHFEDSGRCFGEALQIRRHTGDRRGEAVILNSLAVDLFYQDRFEEALEYLRPALAIHTALDEQRDVGLVLNNIGQMLLELKRHDEALDYLGQALAIVQEIGDRHGEGGTEGMLGDLYRDLSRFDEAVQHYRRAQAAFHDTAREHGDQANVLYGLGSALDSLGRTEQAREAWLTAIPVLDRLGDPRASEIRDRLDDQQFN
jgi:DNA-binding SARP family transcriptional activator/tetratricopeptide (TPR) repeat protein